MVNGIAEKPGDGGEEAAFAGSAVPSVEGRPVSLEAKVNLREALAFSGHRGQEMDAELKERLASAARRCEEELEPKGLFRVFPLDGTAVAGTELRLPGEAIARLLRGCREVALLAVTLGLPSEMLLRRETAVSPTDGLLFDVCASSLVEQGAKALNRLVDEAANTRGLETTWRFSPGYGDMPLDVQPFFLKALGADKALGIRCTPAFMLVPSKSITAIVGLYDPAERSSSSGDDLP